jgi:hypothetical protein
VKISTAKINMNIKLKGKGKLAFILSGLLIGYIGNMSPARADNRCEQAVGNWAWDTRGFVATIFDDGTVVGNDGGTVITATWSCINARKGIIAVDWNTDFVDTLTISPDGKSMSGVNNKGHTSLRVIRRN